MLIKSSLESTYDEEMKSKIREKMRRRIVKLKVYDSLRGLYLKGQMQLII